MKISKALGWVAGLVATASLLYTVFLVVGYSWSTASGGLGGLTIGQSRSDVSAVISTGDFDYVYIAERSILEPPTFSLESIRSSADAIASVWSVRKEVDASPLALATQA